MAESSEARETGKIEADWDGVCPLLVGLGCPMIVGPIVDWGPIRAEFVERGDAEGLRELNNSIASVKTQWLQDKWGRRLLCEADVLDWARDRSGAWNLLAELRRTLEIDADSSKRTCERWRGLAVWARRFARGHANVISLDKDQKSGGLSPPEVVWCRAFRETSNLLLQYVEKPEDLPVHRLLQSLDEILGGETVAITDQIREVDVLVRAQENRGPKAGRTPGDPDQHGSGDLNIFLSYSTRDRKLVEQFRDLLRPLEGSVFLDCRSIEPGADWREAIDSAVASSDLVYVFWSRSSSGSEEVRREWVAAIQGGIKVVPVVVDETPLCPELARFQAVDSPHRDLLRVTVA